MRDENLHVRKTRKVLSRKERETEKGSDIQRSEEKKRDREIDREKQRAGSRD